MRPRVALATAARLPDLDEDGPALLATDKTYLLDLARAGVPVVPTLVDPPVVPVDGRDWVVKPVVGAGAEEAARWRPEQRADAAAHLSRLRAAGRSALVQPYQSLVDTEGETALVVLGGALSHAVSKGQILRSGGGVQAAILDKDEREVIEGRTATPAQLKVAAAALAAVPGGPERLLYARVDLVPGEAGEPLELELELAEPSLFLAQRARGQADLSRSAV